MTNKEIARTLKMTADLMEIHEENPFKIRTYVNAAFTVERSSGALDALSVETLEQADGIGKSIAKAIADILATGTFEALEQVKFKTPTGVIDMMTLKGLGPKKIKVLWHEHHIESIDQLREACTQGRIAAIKGFGAKTQESILETLQYREQQKGKALYADAEPIALQLMDILQKKYPNVLISFTGEIRRKSEVITSVDILVAGASFADVHSLLSSIQMFRIELKRSGPFALCGTFEGEDLSWRINFTSVDKYHGKLLLLTGSEEHLNSIKKQGTSLGEFLLTNHHPDEESYYAAFQLPYIIPELREGLFDHDRLRQLAEANLLQETDIRGAFHNHSTYSDGKNTLRVMAEYCISLGYEYLGISDHSKSAFYANGLQEFQIFKQHEEIDKLNEELAPFVIFKGIESDILNDGALDYEPAILKTFDFIVASVHSNLTMDSDKATKRLVKAIENPYTTMLGHPTGRLLLRRPGYSIDHKQVIDACAEHGVIIEINANPWRLDLDWRWVSYALEKGVVLSINPDAHELDGIHDMRYGVLAGRKGGLTREMTFNTRSLAEVRQYLDGRKAKTRL